MDTSSAKARALPTMSKGRAIPADPAKPKKIALIVAISVYENWTAIHSDRDVPLIRAALMQHGFDSTNIDVVTGQAATRDGILGAIRSSLVERASPGDIVVFHYSGHGHRITDDNGDESDGYDEILVPYDAPSVVPEGYAGELHVRDDDLGVLLTQLRSVVGPSGNLLVFLDSCYSDSGTRNIAPQRRASPQPIGPPADTSKPSETQREGGGFYEVTSTATRGYHDQTTSDLAPYVVISAARFNEVAQETKDREGLYVGSLSLALSRALATATPEMSYRALFNDIENHMSAMEIDNRPQAEGDLDTKVFNGTAVSQQPYFRIGGFVEEENLVRLLSGEIRGLIPDSEIEFHPSGSREALPETRLATGVVIEADPTRALVRIDGQLDTESLRDSWAFVTKQSFGDLRLGVLLSTGLSAQQRRRLQQRLSKSPAAYEDPTDPDVAIGVDPKSGQIFAKAVVSRLQISDDVDPDLANWDNLVLSRVEDYARNRYLQKMTLKDKRLSVRFEIVPVDVECQRNRLRGNLKCRLVGERSVSDLLTAGNELEFTIGDWFVTTIVNEGPDSAWVSILDLMPNGAIEVLWPPRERNDHVIPPSSSYRVDQEGIFFRVCPPAGREMLKLVASRDRINFHLIRTRSRGEGNELEQVFHGIFGGERTGDAVRNVPTGGISTKERMLSVVGSQECPKL